MNTVIAKGLKGEVMNQDQAPTKIFNKLLIIGILCYAAYFTERVLDIFEKVQSEPTVTIGFVFGFLFGQLWNMATIKKTKDKMKVISEANKNRPTI